MTRRLRGLTAVLSFLLVVIQTSNGDSLRQTRQQQQSLAATQLSEGVIPTPNAVYVPGSFNFEQAKQACTAKSKVLCTVAHLADARARGFCGTSWGWFADDPGRDIMASTCTNLYCGADCLYGFPSTNTPAASGAYCCDNVPATSLASCPSSCTRSWIGDGYCDPQCNIEACRFDDGDCCKTSCYNTCAKAYSCGHNGFDCVQPSPVSSCSARTASPTYIDVASDQEWDKLQELHHTSKFAGMRTHRHGEHTVVLRRGQPIPVRVTFEGTNIQPESVKFYLKLKSPGSKTKYLGTLQPLPPVTKSGHKCVLPTVYSGAAHYGGCTPEGGAWAPWCYVEGAPATWSYCDLTQKTTRTVVFNPPVNAPIGSYVVVASGKDVAVATTQSVGGGVTLSSTLTIGLVFNPYLAQDDTYMTPASNLGFYLEPDQVSVWRGATSYSRWDLATYTNHVVTLALVDFADSLSEDLRTTPEAVARELSYWVNHALLRGRWSTPYEDGTTPWTWTSTAEIAEAFHTSGKQVVKYGQCWVFATVTASLSRCLGIPARVDTNILSAHEVPPYDLYIDEKWKKESDGGYVRDRSADEGSSVWNWHVWTVGWFKRHTVTGGDGWNMYDATPQEKSSDGRYAMGPASLQRVKSLVTQSHAHNRDSSTGSCFDLQGVVACNRKTAWVHSLMKKYDEPFAVAEVSATKRVYVSSGAPGAQYVLYSMRHDVVGTKTLTQKPFGAYYELVDVSDDYKPSQYRFAAASSAASSKSGMEGLHVSPRFMGAGGGMDMHTIVPDAPVALGDSIRVGVRLASTSTVDRVVEVTIRGDMVNNAGSAAGPNNRLVLHRRTIMVAAGRTLEETAWVPLSDYLVQLEEDHLCRFTVSAEVRGTGQLYLDTDIGVEVMIPPVDVGVEITDDGNLMATAKWASPIKELLEDCVLFAHLSGTEHTVRTEVGPIAGLSTLSYPVVFPVKADGLHSVTMALSCARLMDITGFREVNLQE